MKLASTRLVTNDVQALADFYKDVVQVEPNGGEDFIEFRLPGAVLAICSQRAVNAYNAGAASPASNRSAILEFEVADVDEERARLAARVRDWVMEPTSQPWGNRSALFRDPDGNLINLYTPAAQAKAHQN